MRTTISIDAGLFDDARRLADELGTSFSGLVSECLRERLMAPRSAVSPAPWRPVTFGGDGLRPGVRWSDLHAVAADDEVERLLAAEP
jgi:hypothetical protein